METYSVSVACGGLAGGKTDGEISGSGCKYPSAVVGRWKGLVAGELRDEGGGVGVVGGNGARLMRGACDVGVLGV